MKNIIITLLTLILITTCYIFLTYQPTGVIVGKLVVPAHEEYVKTAIYKPDGSTYFYDSYIYIVETHYVLVQKDRDKINRVKVKPEEWENLHNGQQHNFYE